MKVGLKEILSLLAAGYKKKDIDAMIAADEEQVQEVQEQVEQAQPETHVPDPIEKEPDYKKMYEDLLKEKEQKDQELTKKEETIRKIQKENVNSNNLPEMEKIREEEQASLIDAIRSFY